jgi:DNA helicase II / ATP-dependent DNA helicase PcrA
MINVASGQSPENKVVVTAHELGHYKLHRDPRNEVTALAPGLGGDPIDSGAGRVEGYSRANARKFRPTFLRASFCARRIGCTRSCSRMAAGLRT